MDKTPYVHNSTAELEAMGLLAHGSNSVVFHTVGLLMPGGTGASVQDIAKYTGLSERTIRVTLAILLSSGLIDETKDGNYTAVRYIEYRGTNNVRTAIDQSIYRQSINPNQSSSSKLYTEKEFSLSYQALCDMLLLVGGIRSDEAEAFKVLWAEHPDPAVHARAVKITMERAERPNYRYYEAVVRSGAVEYPTKQERIKRAKDSAPVIEVQL